MRQPLRAEPANLGSREKRDVIHLKKRRHRNAVDQGVSTEELELQEVYGDTDIMIVPTREGTKGIRRVSEHEADRIAPPRSEDWLME